MLLQIAEFFEVSLDMLVGYGWHKGGMGQALERIRQLKRGKELGKAMAEAEKALLKYPNSFDVVYESAMVYFLTMGPKHQNRAIELFQRACQLIDQNTNERIGLVSIQNQIAHAYLALEQNEKALEPFKKNNFNGLNNAAIGLVLAQRMQQADEAGKNSYLDKGDVLLLGSCAQLFALKGEPEQVWEYLRQAREAALRFDAAPNYSMCNVKFYHADSDAIAYDDISETAIQGIERMMEDEALASLMRQIWKEPEKEFAAG